MRRFALSLRHQVLLLGALATGSIWVGALLQTMHLSDKAELLAQVRRDVDAAKQFAEVARYVAQERDLTYGWQLQQAASLETVQLAEQADARILQVGRRLLIVIGVLAVLAIVTLCLVLSTVRRLFTGLIRLFDGMESVYQRCNFVTRIDASGRDEFAVAAHHFGVGHGIAASVGVSSFGRGQNPDALMALAEAHWQAAQAVGRDRVMPLPQSVAVAS